MRMLRLTIAALLAAAGWALSTEAGAQADSPILKAKGCTNCHEGEKKKVGPAMKEIAARKPAVDATVAKIKDAKGHPKVSASEAEIKQGVEAMLNTK